MCTVIGLIGEDSSLRESGEPRLLGKEGRPHSQGTIKKSQTKKNNIVREEDQKENMARDSSQHRLSRHWLGTQSQNVLMWLFTAVGPWSQRQASNTGDTPQQCLTGSSTLRLF